MREMNFLPTDLAKAQHNQQLLKAYGKALLLCIVVLGMTAVGLRLTNAKLSRDIATLEKTKQEVSLLLEKSSEEKENLKKSQLIADSLNNLHSFNALTAVLDMLNQTQPSNTRLTSIETEFNQEGESSTRLEGIADSHQNLVRWINEVKKTQGVSAADLVSTESTQSSDSDELQQRFVLMVTRNTLEQAPL